MQFLVKEYGHPFLLYILEFLLDQAGSLAAVPFTE